MKKVMLGFMLMLVFQVCTSELSEIDGVIGDHVDLLGGGGDPVSKIPNDKFLGQYFSPSNGGNPISTRIENRIRHDFNSPVRNDIVLNDLGAKWSGDFYFVSGEYNFAINSDKGVKLLIDNEVVLNEVGNSGASVYNVSQQLDGVHRVVVEYNLSEEPTANTNQEVQPEADSPAVVDPEPEVTNPVPVVVPEIVDPIVIDPVVVEPEPEVVEPEPEVVEPEPEVVEPEPEVIEPEPEVVEPEPEVIEPEPEVVEPEPEVVEPEPEVIEPEPEVIDAVEVDPEPVVEENSDTPTIEVAIEPIDSSCKTNGGKAGETGLKTWCWQETIVPDYSGSKGETFSDGQLTTDSECFEGQIKNVGERVRFAINAISPDAGNWCGSDYNLRAEIRTNPWNVRHALGTEEWFGYEYSFGEGYKIDTYNDWVMMQVQDGVVGHSPHFKLMIIRGNQFKGHEAGELYVTNNGNYPGYHPTGITPRAGQTLKVVVHAIWGDSSNGLLQVWINDKKVYDEQERTVYSENNWGGNAKFGIYKHGWRKAENAQNSVGEGSHKMETFLGALRIITRKPSDSNYRKDAYEIVAPR